MKRILILLMGLLMAAWLVPAWPDDGAPVEPAQDAAAAAGSYGPVKTGETLWSIATRLRPNPRITTHQALLALYKANPEAFAAGMDSGALPGVTLRVPTAEQMRATPQAEAAAEIDRLRTPNAAPAGAGQAGPTPALPAVATMPAGKCRATILLYHHIEPYRPGEGAAEQELSVPPEVFDQQMQYLQDGGYAVIPFAALADCAAKGGTLPPKAVVITMDDGWASQYQYALPTLVAHGYTATFFVVTDLVARSEGGKLLSWRQVADLDARGMTVASHSRSHQELTLLGDAALKDEIAGSKKKLEEQLGKPVRFFAYPYGTVSSRVMAAAQAADYEAARGVGWQRQYAPGDMFDLKAVPAPGDLAAFVGAIGASPSLAASARRRLAAQADMHPAELRQAQAAAAPPAAVAAAVPVPAAAPAPAPAPTPAPAPARAPAPPVQAPIQADPSWPSALLALQRQASTSSLSAADGARIDLVDLNPTVPRWYLLRVSSAAGARWAHLDLGPEGSARASLAADGSLAIERPVGTPAGACALATPAQREALLALPLEPFSWAGANCPLWVRGLAAHPNKSEVEAATDLLRLTGPLGENLITWEKEMFPPQGDQSRGASAHGGRLLPAVLSPDAPPPALLSGRAPGEIVADELQLVPGQHLFAPGQWVPVPGAPQVWTSVSTPAWSAPIAAGLVAAKSVPPLSASAASLAYLVAFELASYDARYAVGVDHPALSWSPRVAPQNRIPQGSPGPDGFASAEPLRRSGTVPPWDLQRLAGIFSGGFKREHSAFSYGPYATPKTLWSHYGFAEAGTVLSTLRPGLATFLQRPGEEPRIVEWGGAEAARGTDGLIFARQNGLSLVSGSEPGAHLQPGGGGNWSGNVEGSFETIRSAICTLSSRSGKRFLVYAYFSKTTPADMATLLLSYGCDNAMQLDMNAPSLAWAAVAVRSSAASAPSYRPLIRSMGAPGADARFVHRPDTRDFVYLVQQSEADIRLRQSHAVVASAVAAPPPVAQASAPAATVAAPAPAVSVVAESHPPPPSAAPQAAAGGSTMYGPVKSTETLWSVASQLRSDKRITIYQAMLALYDANPDAFENGMDGGVRPGSTLHIPSAEAMLATAADIAQARISRLRRGST